MHSIFASRKFLMFLMVIVVATAGWIYALIYKTDQLATICTFIVTLLTGYTGANLTDTHLANKLAISKSPDPVPAPPPTTGVTGGQDNG